jgi:hypothetical protein
MGRYDLDWIIILFFIYHNYFRVETYGGIVLKGHFSARSQFGKFGSGTFWSHFVELNGIFWGSSDQNSCPPLDGVLNFDTFPMVYTMFQSRIICKIYASHKLNYHVDHHGMRGCHFSHVIPLTHAYEDIHVKTFNKNIEGSKPYHNQRLIN